MTTKSGGPVPGLFTLVLHTHLPWLAHHGRWPVGEEWLYQSWSAAYLPLMRVLRTLAAEGRRHLLTLGVTPVVAAQLDDPYCLDGMHHWLANWQLRAEQATTLADLRPFGLHERAATEQALEDFALLWRHGASPLLRELAQAETVELLGGPLAHPFQPLLAPRLRDFALREGLADARARLDHRPTGIWAPECAYTPGLEHGYAAAGSRTSWSTARRCTATPRWAGPSGTPTSSRSAATCRSVTGSGRRSRATPVTTPTGTSTPTTTEPASSRPG